jgi:hypothetical protein
MVRLSCRSKPATLLPIDAAMILPIDAAMILPIDLNRQNDAGSFRVSKKKRRQRHNCDIV